MTSPIETEIKSLAVEAVEVRFAAKDLEHDEQLAAMAALIGDMQAQIDGLGGPQVDPVEPPAPPVDPVDPPEQSSDLIVGDFEVLSANLFDDGDEPGLQPIKVPGLRYVPVIYQQHFTGAALDKYEKLTDAAIRNAVANDKILREGIWQADWPGIMIDLENWRFMPTAFGETLRRSLRLYADVCKRMADVTGRPVGCYNVAPGGGIVAWTQIGDMDENGVPKSPAGRARLAQIQAGNDIAAEELVPHVAYVAPQLYTYYSSPNSVVDQSVFIPQWQRFARGTIAEAHRIAPDLPCLPVLWHEMHNGGQYGDFRNVPEDYWRTEWETIKEAGADGGFWWGGYNMIRAPGEEVLESYQENTWAHQGILDAVGDVQRL